MKKTTAIFQAQVKALVADEYLVLGEYKKNNVPVLMKHTTCGRTWNVMPVNFLSHHSRCPYCNPSHKAKDMQTFCDEVLAALGAEYEVLEPYVNNHTPLLVSHRCGHKWRARPQDLLHGHGCPYCAGNHKKLPIEYKTEITELCDGEFFVLEPYQNSKTPIKMQHRPCNHTWEVSPNNFLAFLQCPKCMSKRKPLFAG